MESIDGIAQRAERAERAGKNGRTGDSSASKSTEGKQARRSPKYPRYAHIVGWGMATPEQVMTNEQISRLVDTSDEWIMSRSGIKERRIAEDKETTTSLAIEAAQHALDMADVLPGDVDLVIVATSTPEYAFPATACLVQDAIGAEHAAAFDISAACTGFITALGIASESIRSGSSNAAVVVGAETMSRVINWEDRGTCVLFGDGAGAIVLQGSETPGGILSYLMRSDGSGSNLLALPSIGAVRPANMAALLDHTIEMNGREVFRFATRVIASITREAIALAGLNQEDISLIIPHQANRRIIEAAARGLELPAEKFYINLDRYGNTSAASIPIALCEAVAEKRVQPNDRIVFVGFGGGLTWGAIVAHWGVTPPAAVSRWRQLGRQTLRGLAHLRSAGRRMLRRMEGVLFGSQAPEGVKPPHREGKK